MSPPVSVWRLRTLDLKLDKPRLMGILNVTPDSFSDGGRYFFAEAARERVLQMAEEGADLIDIGAESTRPGASPVDAEEEWSRLEPVLRFLPTDLSLPISVDTRHGEVARRALDLGVEAINDVSTARDPDLLAAVAAARCGYVLMHGRGDSKTMGGLADYQDLLGEVSQELRQGWARVQAAGVEEGRLAIDPGFGFAKTPEQNWEILARLPDLSRLGFPLLVGLSRKRMVRECVGERAEALAAASAAAAAVAVRGGARILRVHDLAATRATLQVLQKTGFIP